MSENAKKTVVENFDIENYIVQLNEMYKKVNLKIKEK